MNWRVLFPGLFGFYIRLCLANPNRVVSFSSGNRALGFFLGLLTFVGFSAPLSPSLGCDPALFPSLCHSCFVFGIFLGFEDVLLKVFCLITCNILLFLWLFQFLDVLYSWRSLMMEVCTPRSACFRLFSFPLVHCRGSRGYPLPVLPSLYCFLMFPSWVFSDSLVVLP